MNWIILAKTILELLPAIIKAVAAIEEALPGQGQGQHKLAVVKATLEQAYATGSGIAGAFESLWPAIAGTVGAVVNAMNAVGTFKKG